MLFQSLLWTHIISGVLGLVLGPIAMGARKTQGRHTQIGEIYHGLMLVVCLTAIGLGILHWEKSAYLVFVAIFSYAFASQGYLAAKLRRKGWLPIHISGMLGSYIALVTALLVVNASQLPGIQKLPTLWVWILPTLIGSPWIARVASRYRKKN